MDSERLFVKVELSGQYVRVREDSVWTCRGCGKSIRARMAGQVAMHKRVCAQLVQVERQFKRPALADWLQPGYDDGNPEYETYTAAFGNWHLHRRGRT